MTRYYVCGDNWTVREIDPSTGYLLNDTVYEAVSYTHLDVYKRQQLGISPHQLSYVTHSGPGEGLLFFGNVIIPFVDHFPKDTLLYSVLTTRPDEVAGA